MKNKIIYLLLFMLFILIVGCSSQSEITTPMIVINGNIVQWTKINNADSYVVKIDNEEFVTETCSYELKISDTLEHLISVKALINNISSNYSSEVKYQSGSNRLDSPVIHLDDNKIIWDSITGAEQYEVHLGLNFVTTTDCFYEIDNDKVTDNITVFVISKASYKNNSLASNLLNYTKIEVKDINNKVNLLDGAKYDLEGTFANVINLVNERQLYDKLLWSKFVEQFRTNTDGKEYGWRGEFWGKMLEGACVTYKATLDEKLYNILTLTVEDMLTTQHPDGSITSYGKYQDPDNNEFQGWDLWCRTWSITGMLYYYEICQDQELKARVLKCLEGQLDYICNRVGDDKMNINDTASQWGGLPSNCILESVCKMYRITGKQTYLELATHIVKNGGSKYGNQIEQAIENKTYPYTWGAPKAGELCLFFDGVVEYYLITGIEKYKTAAVNYWYLVNESEITIVGGGCTKDEQFEHSVIEQCDPTRTNAMQEYCVTIHWMNLSKDIYQLVGDSKIIDSLERTIYNAVLCCIDNEGNYDHVFTSYNNIMYSVRSTSAAGGMSLQQPEQFAYGCCISQGSIATGLIPRLQYANYQNGIICNLYLPGKTTQDYNGNEITITNTTVYPKENTINLKVETEKEEEFTIKLRIPSWSTNTLVYVNGVKQENVKNGEYYSITKAWHNDEIKIVLDLKLKEVQGSEQCSNPNGKNNVALVYGPITFARDARLDNGEIFETVEFTKDENGDVKYTLSNTGTFENIIEIEVELTNGEKIHLVNYGNAGKTYSFSSMFTVYMPTTDYWKSDLSEENKYLLINCCYNALSLTSNEDGLVHLGNDYQDYDDYQGFLVRFEETEDGYYYIIQDNTNKYLTIVDRNGHSYLAYNDFTGNDDQKFYFEHASLMSYKLCCKKTSFIVSANNEKDAIWLYSDCSSNKQFWKLLLVK